MARAGGAGDRQDSGPVFLDAWHQGPERRGTGMEQARKRAAHGTMDPVCAYAQERAHPMMITGTGLLPGAAGGGRCTQASLHTWPHRPGRSGIASSGCACYTPATGTTLAHARIPPGFPEGPGKNSSDATLCSLSS